VLVVYYGGEYEQGVTIGCLFAIRIRVGFRWFKGFVGLIPHKLFIFLTFVDCSLMCNCIADIVEAGFGSIMELLVLLDKFVDGSR